MFAAGKTAAVSGAGPDDKFNYVTMLLHGDGTNGAQNNTFLDSSTNNFTITRTGNTTQGSFSPYGSNWSNFNPDSSNGLGVATNTALNMGTGDFTVEAWVNTAKLPTTNAFQTSSGGYQCVFGTGPSNSSSGTQLYIGVTNLKFDISSDGGGPIDVAHNMVAGQWYHVAISRSSTTFKAFINGVLVQTATSSSSWVDGYNYGLMRAEPIGSYDGAWWYGYVSNFRLIKGTAIYTSSFTPSTTPLTAISGTSLLTCQSNRFIDNSSNNFTISVNNSPSVQRFNPFGASTAYSTSVIGGSGYFDGSGDYLSVADNTALNLSGGDYTLEAWIYWNGSTANYRTIIAKRVASTDNSAWEIFLNITSGNICFFDGTIRNSGVKPVPNCWNHIAACWNNSTSQINMYLNGARILQTSATNTNQSASVYIGSFPSYSEDFGGNISDVRVVKGSQVYTGTTYTVPTAPLTAISGTSLLCNMTNGAIFDNAMMNDLETVGNAQISTTVKKYGTGSLYFDGTGDYLTGLSNPIYAVGTTNFTVEAWIYPTAFSAYRSVFDTRTTLSNAGMVLGLANSSAGVWGLYKGAGVTVVQSSTNLTSNTWQHIAAVRSGSTVTLYLNGVNVGSATDGEDFTQQGCNVGRTFDNYTWSGYIDDLRVTRGYARYTANFTPPTAAFPNTGPI